MSTHPVRAAGRAGTSSNAMKLFGLSGGDAADRLSLLEGLVASLKAKGLAVAVLVEAPDGFDIDRPGKDSHEHRRAGAHEVVIASAKRWALLHENHPKQGSDVPEFAAAIEGADLLLLLGFEVADQPRLAILDAGQGDAAATSDPRRVVVRLPDGPGAVRLDGAPVHGLEDYDGIADFILSYHGLGQRASRHKKP